MGVSESISVLSKDLPLKPVFDYFKRREGGDPPEVVPSRDSEVVVTENSCKLSFVQGGVHRVVGSDINVVDSVDLETVVA